MLMQLLVSVVVCGCEDHPLQKGVFLAFGITADDSEL
jgi:hypothetical protein